MESINPQNSSFYYSPCGHSNGEVVCDGVPLEAIQKAFKRSSSPKLLSVKLILQPGIFSETVIPEDIFATTQILDIRIDYPFGSCCDTKLQVDAGAFRATKSYTNTFHIDGIECALLDLDFLSGFDQLTSLSFHNIQNIQHCLPSLPPLPRLTTLQLKFCTGINQLNIFPTLTNGLKDFQFSGDVNVIDRMYNDETVDRVMDWILLSCANSLERITIDTMKKVTRVPHKIPSFKALKQLQLYENNISTIKSGAFSFSVPVSELSLNGNGIKEIEPGAFQG